MLRRAQAATAQAGHRSHGGKKPDLHGLRKWRQRVPRALQKWGGKRRDTCGLEAGGDSRIEEGRGVD